MRDEYYDDEISYEDVDGSWQDEDDAWEEPARKEAPGRSGRKAPQRRRPGDAGTMDARQIEKRAAGKGTARSSTGTTSPMADLLLLLFKVGLVVVFLLILMTFFYGMTQVRDVSMNPAFKEGDLVIYYRLDKDYVSRDAIVVDYNGTLQVRRVVAVAGDTVDIGADGGLIINGSTQIEDSIYTTTLPYTDGITFPVTVGDGEVFVLGDNRTNAEDSRVYGTVSIAATKGAVMTVVRRRGF